MTCFLPQILVGTHPKKLTQEPTQSQLKKSAREIVDFLSQHQTEIETGQLAVFFVDECHLMGGDVCGYVWGQTNTRIEMTIKNTKDRQTYFGALDYQTS